MKKLFVITFLILTYLQSMSQGVDCFNASPFCTDTSYLFPAAVNVPSLGTYQCLISTPDPFWYYMQIADPGDINIFISSSPATYDIDFACWGPFSSVAAGCAMNLQNTPTVDCSFSPSATENCNITNAQTGEIYILLLTNYSQLPCNIAFSQTSGAGSTDCGILAPPVNNNGPLCEGETLNLTAQQGPAGCTYYWVGPDGFTSTLQNPVIPNVTLAMAGDYFLQVILGVDTSNAVSTTVVIYPIPTSSFTVSLDSVCVNEATTLNYTGTASSTATYAWDVDGGSPNVITGPGPHNVLWGTTGDVNVSLTVTENGCTSPPTNIPVFVKPIPTSTFTAVSPICLDKTSTITFTGTAAANATYNWGFTGGTVQSGSVVGPYEISWPTEGNYSISLIVIDNGCTSEQTFQSVDVLPLPIVNVVTDINSGCVPLIVHFSDTINNPPAVYDWTFGDGPPNNSIQNPIHTFSFSGNYTVTLTVTDTNGCINSGNANIIAYPLPTADFSFTPSVGTVGLPITFTSASLGNMNSWTWNFGDGTIESGNFPSIIHSFASTGYQTVSLLVETINGCLDSISKQILIIDIVVPNVFTPNNDGINEKFVIKGIELVSGCQLLVFNRWGNKVFESSSYQNNWDGKDVADGTYYFIFSLPENIIEPINGTITILR